jgi:hypothetical protein
MNNKSRITDLLIQYRDLKAEMELIAKEADKVRASILSMASPGNYGPGTVYQTEEIEIEVHAYTRKGYKAIALRKSWRA